MFKNILLAFMKKMPERTKTKEEIDSAAKTLFDFFDKDKTNVLDFGEIFIGLTLLLDGTETEKIRVAFKLYDINGDGNLSYNELQHFFTCYFNIILHENPITDL